MDEPVDGRFFPMRVCGRGVLGDRLVYETGVSTTKDKVWLFLLGAIGIYGFMFSLFSGA